MTEESIHSNVPGSVPELRAPQTPGEWLRAERERQNRTVQQIAEEMHLGIHIVEAMENNQFSVLGASVFARGHLRKYASLLNVPVDRVQELYLALTDRPRDEDPVPVTQRVSEPAKAMSPDSRQRRDEQLPPMWTGAIAAGGLAIISVLVWFLVRTPVESPPEVAEAPEEVQASATVDPPATQPESTVAPAPSPPAVAPSAAPPKAATPSPSRAKLGLRFSFTAESWVEVYDSRGTRLLYDVGQPGQSRSVQVEGPAQVVLGQAGNVSTEVNGRVVEVPPKRVTNQVARFTIGADGNVQ